MAKTSSIEKNNRRRKLSKQFAGKRAKLKALTKDQSVSMSPMGSFRAIPVFSFQLVFTMPGACPKLPSERRAMRLSLSLR